VSMLELATYKLDSWTHRWTARDKYQYNPNGKAPWLQRLCFRVLDKLQAHAEFQEIKIMRTRLDLDKLVDALMRNKIDVERIYNKRAKYLVIGGDKWLALTNDTAHNLQMFTVPYDFNARVGFNSTPTPKMFAGLKVIVVPWVDGLFVLPELE
jgi:hypothetical protein